MADNVRLVRWSAPGSGGRIYDTVRFDAATVPTWSATDLPQP